MTDVISALSSRGSSCLTSPFPRVRAYLARQVTLDFKEEFRVSLTYLMICLLAAGLTAFFGFHAYLVCANYTTIEFLEKRRPPDPFLPHPRALSQSHHRFGRRGA